MSLNHLVIEAQSIHADPSKRQRSAELEQEIQKRLRAGEHLEDPVLQLALKGHARSETRLWPSGVVYSKSAFEVVPLVNQVIDAVDRFEGQRVLSSYGPDIWEEGVISGSAFIEPWSDWIDSLLIPVTEHQKTDKAWLKYGEGKFLVPNDIFKQPFPELETLSQTQVTLREDGAIFRHVYEGTFAGGLPAGDKVLYIGNSVVEAGKVEVANTEYIDTSCHGCTPPEVDRELNLLCPIDNSKLQLYILPALGVRYIQCDPCHILYTEIGGVGDDESTFPTSEELQQKAFEHLDTLVRLDDRGRSSYEAIHGGPEGFDRYFTQLVEKARKMGMDI